MEIDLELIQAMYDYHYAQVATEPNEKADGIFVFGRYDWHVPETAAWLYTSGYGRYVMVSGGLGKDSGYLTTLSELPGVRVPEAAYLAILANSVYGVPTEALV